MVNFNQDFSSSISVKPSFIGVNNENENESNSETVSKLKSPNKKQLPTKHFMSPTISAASKANVPIRKVLTERNETVDVVESNSVVRSLSSFGSKPVKLEDGDLKPYDPVKNYLSPRPKFLRYNPNRRRNVSVFKGNEDEDSVKSSISSFDVDSGSMLPSMDSCLNKESVDDEVENEVDEKSESEDVEGDETEDEDEDDAEDEDGDEYEMDGFEESRCLSWKGFFKFLFVVMAVIVSTQAICSMNLPSDSQTLESVWSLNRSYNTVYGSASSNFCEVDFRLIKEADLGVYKGLDGIDEVVIEGKIENDRTDVIQIDIRSKYENIHHLQKTEILLEQEVVASEAIVIDNVEAEREVYEFKQDTDHLQKIEVLKEQELAENEVIEIYNEAESEQKVTIYLQQTEVLQEQQIAETDVIETGDVETENEVYDITQFGFVEEDDTDIDESNYQLTAADARYKITEETKTLAFIIGLSILTLTFFVVVYHSKRSKASASSISTTVPKENNVAEKQEIKILNLAPVPSDESTEPLVNTYSLQNEECKEISYIHAPSVELLGEFVFGEEVTSSVYSYNISVPAEDDTSNSLIQPTTVSSIRTKLSQMEMSTGESHTVQKQKRKNSDLSSTSSNIVTPSPVRRSSRIRSRPVRLLELASS